jgi:glycosyltransferase involved in cell wall biosynthesis
MKIAQVAPLAESVPPRFYGGTERVVSYLTEELTLQRHEVTLFASGDSRTTATLVPCCERALRLDRRVRDPLPYYLLMLDDLRQRAPDFDILHFHLNLLHFPLFRDIAGQTVTTVHGRLDLADLPPFFNAFTEMPMVSICSDQQRYLPAGANWLATVHHGLPLDLLRFNQNSTGHYVAFLGRIAPEKRPDRAIEIAGRAGVVLKISAKIDAADQCYWRDVIEPLLRLHPSVEFVGEIDDAHKSEFLGNARALLFPVDWPEPFGLVMIEAMACGTPVIAYACGSVPEIVEDGVTGFIVDTIEGAVAALQRIGHLDRVLVRREFERRFSAERMARDYVAVYDALLSRGRMPPTSRLREDGAPAIA